MVLRSGKVDLYHTREASEATQRLIPGAQIADPPWGDDEWYVRTEAQARGEGLFGGWSALIPQILAFAGG
jgi:hypothetical protein